MSNENKEVEKEKCCECDSQEQKVKSEGTKQDDTSQPGQCSYSPRDGTNNCHSLDSDSGSSDSWENVLDPSCTTISQSQACFTKAGKSYTPEGWKRKYKKRSRSTSSAPIKKIKFEN